MVGLSLKHERQGWLVLRRSCAKEEEESTLIIPRLMRRASDRAYYFSQKSYTNYGRPPALAHRHQVFELVEGRLADALDPQQILHRAVGPALDDPLRGRRPHTRQRIQFIH